MMVHAVGMASPRLTTLRERMVQRGPSVAASMVNARVRPSAGGAIRRASCASLRRTGRAAGSALPVTQGLNPRLVAWLEQRGRQDGDGRRTATLRRHDAETPPRRHLPLWCAELREMG